MRKLTPSKPKLIKEYMSLPKNRSSILRVRLIQYDKAPITLDIREFINTNDVLTNGYTHKGINLRDEAVWKLYQILPDVIHRMERNPLKPFENNKLEKWNEKKT